MNNELLPWIDHQIRRREGEKASVAGIFSPTIPPGSVDLRFLG